MLIQRETADKNTITAYDDHHITVDGVIYSDSVILAPDSINAHWQINSLNKLNQDTLAPLLQLRPEVILIGYNGKPCSLPFDCIQSLAAQRLGIELMTIGAACRTFNVLLSENRRVIAGFILQV